MKERWIPVVGLAGLLLAINAVARILVWRGHIVKDTEQMRIGLVAFIAIGVACAVAAAWWTVFHPLSRVLGDMVAVELVGCLLSVLVGPFFGGSWPFAEGGEFVLAQVVQYELLASVGSALGVLGVIASGRDWKAREWKRYEASFQARRTTRSR